MSEKLHLIVLYEIFYKSKIDNLIFYKVKIDDPINE
jgi:hypothetical protein